LQQLKERKIKPGDFVKTPAMDDYKEAHEIAALRQLFGFNRQPLPLQYFGSFDQRAAGRRYRLAYCIGGVRYC
jgi:hypothetical protein